MNITIATWVFGTSSFLFVIGVFLFSPHELPPYKIRILAIISAMLLGFFGFFFSGNLTVGVNGEWPLIGKVALQSSGGIALFLLTIYWWRSQFAPVKPSTLPQDVADAIEKQAMKNLPIYALTDSVKKKLMGKTEKTLLGGRAMGFLVMAKESLDEENPKESIGYCNEALELEPDFPYANYLRGQASLVSGDYEQALNDFNVLIDRLPYSGMPYLGRLQAQVYLNKFDEALKDAEKLCEMGDCTHLRSLQKILKELKH